MGFVPSTLHYVIPLQRHAKYWRHSFSFVGTSRRYVMVDMVFESLKFGKKNTEDFRLLVTVKMAVLVVFIIEFCIRIDD